MGFSIHSEFRLIPPPPRRMPRSLLRAIYTYDAIPSRPATRINTRNPTTNPTYDGTSTTTKAHTTPRPLLAVSQVDYYGFRYYSPELGRWITRDPAGFVDGPNLYTYVVQNPWTMFDPVGLETKDQLEDMIAEEEKNSETYRQQDTPEAKSNLEESQRKIKEYQNRIDELKNVADKWNKAARKDVVDLKTFDDKWDSFKALKNTDVKIFMGIAGASGTRFISVLNDNPDLAKAFYSAAKKNGISPRLLFNVISMESRAGNPIDMILDFSSDGPKRGNVGMHLEAIISAAYNKLMTGSAKDGSFGAAQLGPNARAAAGLSINDAMTWEGSFEGAANYLANNPSLPANPTNRQRAEYYNGGDKAIFSYGVHYEVVNWMSRNVQFSE